MGLLNWLRALVHAIDNEYDRRIKRASNVVAYGIGHHGHIDEQAAAEQAEPHTHADEEAEIINIPLGTPVRQSSSQSEDLVDQQH